MMLLAIRTWTSRPSLCHVMSYTTWTRGISARTLSKAQADPATARLLESRLWLPPRQATIEVDDPTSTVSRTPLILHPIYLLEV